MAVCLSASRHRQCAGGGSLRAVGHAAQSRDNVKHQPSSLGLCSPDWTRTNNPAINSRMLCQLSYGG